jgi:RNA polymerase sigma-70 factor, ECF subfamily
MMADSDAELVDRVRRGSREAAGQLAERYLRPGRAVALAIVGDMAAAEDVAQDAFVYAIDRIDDLRRSERFGGWLMQIVRNRSRNHVRDRKSDRHVTLDRIAIRSGAASPERETERSELRERLLAALAELPKERRVVVLLHDLEGWTHREIAERLDLPQGTVRSHLHHARRAMRERLRGWTED